MGYGWMTQKGLSERNAQNVDGWNGKRTEIKSQAVSQPTSQSSQSININLDSERVHTFRRYHRNPFRLLQFQPNYKRMRQTRKKNQPTTQISSEMNTKKATMNS